MPSAIAAEASYIAFDKAGRISSSLTVDQLGDARSSHWRRALFGATKEASFQPACGFQSDEGAVLIIQGMPNLSTNEPKPGDQKVSSNGMTALPPSTS